MRYINSIVLVLRCWPFAFRLKRYLKRLVRQDARTLKGLLPRRKIKKRISPSRQTYRRLFSLNRNAPRIDISRFKKEDERLAAIESAEPAGRLSFQGAVDVEAQILKKVFGWILGIELSRVQVDELKVWDSPIKVLKAFISYCLRHERVIVEYSLSSEDVLGPFVLNAQEYMRGGQVYDEFSGLISGHESGTSDFWRKQQVLRANLSAIEIHKRSGTIAISVYKEETGEYQTIYQRLRRNYDECYNRLKRIL